MSATTRALLWLALLVAAFLAYIVGSVITMTDRGPLIDREERPMPPLTAATAPGVTAVPYQPEEAENP